MNNWIKVSERLPENDNHYLVTVWEYLKYTVHPRVDTAFWNPERKEFSIYDGYNDELDIYPASNNYHSKLKDCVVAWMPLPDAYVGEL